MAISKTTNTRRLALTLSALSSLVGLYLTSSPANFAVAMLPSGYLLTLIPLFLAPAQYYLIRGACRREFLSQKLLLLFCFLLVFLTPLFASELASRLWLGSVEIPKQNLTSSQIKALQDLEIDGSALPFPVRFNCEPSKVRAIFRKGEDRERAVRAKIRERLDGVTDTVAP